MRPLEHISPVHAKVPGLPEQGWLFVSVRLGGERTAHEAPDRDRAVKDRKAYLAQLRRRKTAYLTYADMAQWRRVASLLKEKDRAISDPGH